MANYEFDYIINGINESKDNDYLSIDAENTELLFGMLLSQYYVKINTDCVPFLMHGNLIENDTYYDDIKTNDDIKIKKEKHNIKENKNIKNFPKYPQKHKETKKYVEQQKFVEPVLNIVSGYPQQISYTHTQPYIYPTCIIPKQPMNCGNPDIIYPLMQGTGKIRIIAPITNPKPRTVEESATYPIHLAGYYWFKNKRKT